MDVEHALPPIDTNTRSEIRRTVFAPISTGCAYRVIGPTSEYIFTGVLMSDCRWTVVFSDGILLLYTAIYIVKSDKYQYNIQVISRLFLPPQPIRKKTILRETYVWIQTSSICIGCRSVGVVHYCICLCPTPFTCVQRGQWLQSLPFVIPAYQVLV